jgi:2,3-bisphosphoglycerate-dependent phosphoglycerate mutase
MMAQNSPTTLLVIRHGETSWNIENRFQGHGDSPLTKTGLKQVEALGRRMRGLDFTRLVASDLKRARDTAAAIAKHSGHLIEVDCRLRERNFGVLEGLTVAEIKNQYPDVFEQVYGNDPDYSIPGGESLRQHYQRNIAFFDEFVTANRGQTAAIVVHGGVLDSLLRHIAGLALTCPRCFVASNASLNIVSYGTYYGTLRWVIQTWGDTSHLNGIGHHRGLG